MCITVLDHADAILLVLSGTGIFVSVFSCTTVIGVPVGIASAGISLVFLVTNENVRMFLKTMVKKKETKKNCFIG